MKYAICNETFQDWPFEKAFKYAKELGYDALEFAPFTIHEDAYQITPERRSEVRALAEANGLKIIGLHWLLAKTEGYYLTTPDDDIRKRTAEYIAEWLACVVTSAGISWCSDHPNSVTCCLA